MNNWRKADDPLGAVIEVMLDACAPDWPDAETQAARRRFRVRLPQMLQEAASLLLNGTVSTGAAAVRCVCNDTTQRDREKQATQPQEV